ncbi:MAG TPA: fibronectin type III domain-containing protein, partial [Candidatus Cloacimonas acidaminovorans]|nr:fibronectin type III domain-containing protein [Candidatus Cloacimonas acidaminovorans]
MKKSLLLMLLFLSVSSFLFSTASFGPITVGISSNNTDPTKAKPGDTITVTYSFTPSGFGDDGLAIGSKAGGINNKIRVYWYTNNDGTGTSSYNDYDCDEIPVENRSITNDALNTKTLTFTMPSIPTHSPKYNSFKVRTQLYGEDSDMNPVTSSAAYSTGIGTDSYAYLVLIYATAPYATNVEITNPDYAKVGQTIYGDYDYNDDEDDEENGTTFRWLRSDSQTGTYTAITGATSQSYTVVQADLGKYLKFEVTPKNSEEPGTGTAVLSDPTGQVTGAPILEFNASYKTIAETSANTGAVSSETYLKIDATNTTFVSDITEDYISIQGLPTGLQVSDVQCLETSNIRIYLSGNATYHEYAASVSNVKITVDDAKLVGVAGDKQTTNSASVNFTNNPPKNLALDSVGNNYVKITWVTPDGLLSSGSGLRNFYIYRNDSYLTSVSSSIYSYTDNGVSNGTQYTYKVLAEYLNGTDEMSADVILATPLAITAFSFSNPQATGTIDHTNKTIKVAVPNGTNRTALIASFTATGAIVKVGTTTQTSGTTANNFTNPVIYTLTTSNDASTCSYTVTVNEILATPVTEDGTITTSSIQAKWGAVSGASSYLLDVSTNSSFSTFLPGYQNKSLTSTSCIVNGLNYNTAYYYRVKAVASDQYFNSEYSTTKEVTTENVAAGEGSTEINSSEETTINVGEYIVSGQGTVIPTVIVNPTAFSPSENNLITVSMSYGATPEGLQYNLSFDNATIGIGTFILSYSGLGYDPTDVGYRLNGGALQSVGGDGINTTAKTVTFEMVSLSKGSKATYELQIVLNDEHGQTLPVVLTSFTATLMVQGKVRLDWVTQSETNLSGFRVMRNSVAEVSTALTVSPLIEARNTSSTVFYSFIDSEVPGNGIYYYWLQIEDLDGGISYSAALTMQVTNGENPNPEIPKITALQKPFPNPFNPDVTIPFDLAVDGNVT